MHAFEVQHVEQPLFFGWVEATGSRERRWIVVGAEKYIPSYKIHDYRKGAGNRLFFSLPKNLSSRVEVLVAATKYGCFVPTAGNFVLPLRPMTPFPAVNLTVVAAPLVGGRAVAGVHHHHHLLEAGLCVGC